MSIEKEIYAGRDIKYGDRYSLLTHPKYYVMYKYPAVESERMFYMKISRDVWWEMVEASRHEAEQGREIKQVPVGSGPREAG